MSETVQNLLVYAIVGSAAAYLLWSVVRWFMPKAGAGGCGGCHGCAKSSASTTLISLEAKPHSPDHRP